jgi:hypothetical protein
MRGDREEEVIVSQNNYLDHRLKFRAMRQLIY